MRESFCKEGKRASLRPAKIPLRLILVLLMGMLSASPRQAEPAPKTVTLSFSNTALEKVCKEIERQSGFYFVYAKDVEKTFFVNINVKDATLEQALSQLFEKIPFSYQLIDKVVVINSVKKHAAAGWFGEGG